MITVIRRGLAVTALLFAACDPRVPRLEVVPESVCAGQAVRVTWRAAEEGTPVRIFANAPTLPRLDVGDLANDFRDPTGSMDVVIVDRDTTFTAAVPGGASVSHTVRVRSGERTHLLRFTGECREGAPPYYAPRALGGTGNVLRLNTDASFPVQVIHAGMTFPVPPGGITLRPPLPPLAGDYQIEPALPVSLRCFDAFSNPVEPPPPISLLVTGDCPAP